MDVAIVQWPRLKARYPDDLGHRQALNRACHCLDFPPNAATSTDLVSMAWLSRDDQYQTAWKIGDAPQ